jgi:hypothetical protein
LKSDFERNRLVSGARFRRVAAAMIASWDIGAALSKQRYPKRLGERPRNRSAGQKDGYRWPSYGWGPQLKRKPPRDISGSGLAQYSRGWFCLLGTWRRLSRSGFSPVAMSTRDFNLASWLDRALGVRLHVGFPSGRLINSNVATWVLSNQDSSVAPQTLQDA